MLPRGFINNSLIMQLGQEFVGQRHDFGSFASVHHNNNQDVSEVQTFSFNPKALTDLFKTYIFIHSSPSSSTLQSNWTDWRHFKHEDFFHTWVKILCSQWLPEVQNPWTSSSTLEVLWQAFTPPLHHAAASLCISLRCTWKAGDWLVKTKQKSTKIPSALQNLNYTTEHLIIHPASIGSHIINESL